MPITFFAFPSEIRQQIYEELLTTSKPLPARALPSRTRRVFPAILRADRRVYCEAVSLLYSKNCICIPDPSASLLTFTIQSSMQNIILHSFLQRIGELNATFLKHMCIPFPGLADYSAFRATIKPECVAARDLLKAYCPSLVIAETLPENSTGVLAHIDGRLVPDPLGALLLIDQHFRDIPSLKEFIVNVFEESLRFEVIERMQSLGWKVKFC